MSCVVYLYNKAGEFYTILIKMCKKDVFQVWKPWDVIRCPTSSNHVFMILNRPICHSFEQKLILNLWNTAKLRVTVDGGTNHWLSWLKLNNHHHCEKFAPDMITGDMDSLSKDALEYFINKNENIQVIQTPDQSETDFTKAIKEVQQHIIKENLEIDTIIVLVDTSGRFDQILANINTLFKVKKTFPHLKIMLLAADSLSWLLTERVVHIINIPSVLKESRQWCSLIPIGSPCKVSTTGLKWNLHNTWLEFGSLVSSSNTYSGDSVVTIRTNKPLVWAMGIRDLF